MMLIVFHGAVCLAHTHTVNVGAGATTECTDCTDGSRAEKL